MPIDFMAGEPHFLDHLAPVWLALPEEERGTFWGSYPSLIERAERMGIEMTYSYGYIYNPVVVASYGDLRRSRHRRTERKALFQHGIGQSYAGAHGSGNQASYPGGHDNADVDLFLCPNDYSAERWHAAYPDASVRVVGSPHAEHLPTRANGLFQRDQPTIAFSFHWQCGITQETRPAFMHFREAIPELKKDYNVIGHAHPRARRWLEPWYKRFGVPFVPEFADVCKQSDVYICDNSSTIYEFASTGRPVVLLNAPWYRRNVEHGLRFWELSSVGINVDEPAHLKNAIDLSLDDPAFLREERERAIQKVYGVTTGATAAAVDALLEWVHSE